MCSPAPAEAFIEAEKELAKETGLDPGKARAAPERHNKKHGHVQWQLGERTNSQCSGEVKS
jgi:hypothetical protein